MDGYIHSLFFSNGNFQSEIFARKARYFFEIIINNHIARNVNEGSIKKFGSIEAHLEHLQKNRIIIKIFE
jgi:hypothetical protein